MDEETKKQLLHMIKVSHPDDIKIELNESVAHVWFRPGYCDRGRVMWDVESKDGTILTIDSADMFPRIYFLAENFVSEFNEWMKARKQHVIEISFRDRNDGAYAVCRPNRAGSGIK